MRSLLLFTLLPLVLAHPTPGQPEENLSVAEESFKPKWSPNMAERVDEFRKIFKQRTSVKNLRPPNEEKFEAKLANFEGKQGPSVIGHHSINGGDNDHGRRPVYNPDNGDYDYEENGGRRKRLMKRSPVPDVPKTTLPDNPDNFFEFSESVIGTKYNPTQLQQARCLLEQHLAAVSNDRDKRSKNPDAPIVDHEFLRFAGLTEEEVYPPKTKESIMETEAKKEGLPVANFQGMVKRLAKRDPEAVRVRPGQSDMTPQHGNPRGKLMVPYMKRAEEISAPVKSNPAEKLTSDSPKTVSPAPNLPASLNPAVNKKFEKMPDFADAKTPKEPVTVTSTATLPTGELCTVSDGCNSVHFDPQNLETLMVLCEDITRYAIYLQMCPQDCATPCKKCGHIDMEAQNSPVRDLHPFPGLTAPGSEDNLDHYHSELIGFNPGPVATSPDGTTTPAGVAGLRAAKPGEVSWGWVSGVKKEADNEEERMDTNEVLSRIHDAIRLHHEDLENNSARAAAEGGGDNDRDYSKPRKIQVERRTAAVPVMMTGRDIGGTGSTPSSASRPAKHEATYHPKKKEDAEDPASSSDVSVAPPVGETPNTRTGDNTESNINNTNANVNDNNDNNNNLSTPDVVRATAIQTDPCSPSTDDALATIISAYPVAYVPNTYYTNLVYHPINPKARHHSFIDGIDDDDDDIDIDIDIDIDTNLDSYFPTPYSSTTFTTFNPDNNINIINAANHPNLFLHPNNDISFFGVRGSPAPIPGSISTPPNAYKKLDGYNGILNPNGPPVTEKEKKAAMEKVQEERRRRLEKENAREGKVKRSISGWGREELDRVLGVEGEWRRGQMGPEEVLMILRTML
ncbi:hypothetical protein EX30DRAFT_373471 [Ascodesmis nigricans]|uniref:ShKT domain-containing protein n=1 Tax=Ascodesmis nigricans TaxID=341454 RepID=A0A4S2MRU8_9PEZI|nr:hypothetical protein EX30DRAFT_373471 [Ascodesmis nigricans]